MQLEMGQFIAWDSEGNGGIERARNHNFEGGLNCPCDKGAKNSGVLLLALVQVPVPVLVLVQVQV